MGCASSKALTCEEAPVPTQVPTWFSTALFDFFALAMELKRIRENPNFPGFSVEEIELLKPIIFKLTSGIWSAMARSIGASVYENNLSFESRYKTTYDIADLVEKKISGYEVIRIMNNWLIKPFILSQIKVLGHQGYFEKSFPTASDCKNLIFDHIELGYEDKFHAFSHNYYSGWRITPSQRGKAGIEYGIVF